MIFHENRLPEDDSHEISCLICLFAFFKQQNLKVSSAANYRWRYRAHFHDNAQIPHHREIIITGRLLIALI